MDEILLLISKIRLGGRIRHGAGKLYIDGITIPLTIHESKGNYHSTLKGFGDQTYFFWQHRLAANAIVDEQLNKAVLQLLQKQVALAKARAIVNSCPIQLTPP